MSLRGRCLGGTAAIALLVAGGCGVDDGQGSGRDLSVAELETALLTEEDVGSGFSLDPNPDDDNSDFEPDFDNAPGCEEAEEIFELTDDDEDAAEVAFLGEGEAEVGHSLSPIDDDPGIGELVAALEGCGAVPFDDEGFAGELRFTVEPFDGLGEEAAEVTFVIELTSPLALTFEGFGVLVERGDIGSAIIAFGGFDEEELEGLPVDEEQVRELARVADERLQELLEG